MVSQTSKYAFHVLGFLVNCRDGLTPGDDIAAATGVPANYLSKILNQLRKAGIVESRKGWGGGFRVLDDALQRPIRDILVVLDGEGSVERNDCAFGLPRCDIENPCPLHDHWEQIRATYDSMLADFRIVDLSVGGV